MWKSKLKNFCFLCFLQLCFLIWCAQLKLAPSALILGGLLWWLLSSIHFSVPEDWTGYGAQSELEGTHQARSIPAVAGGSSAFALTPGEDTCNPSLSLAFHVMKTPFWKLPYLQKASEVEQASNGGFVWAYQMLKCFACFSGSADILREYLLQFFSRSNLSFLVF